MAKPRRFLARLLTILNEKPLTSTEICNINTVRRETVWKNIKKAQDNHWIQKDEVGRYHITEFGKSMINLAERSVDSVSFEVYSQVIDLIGIRSEKPKANCTIIIQDAKKIKEADDSTVAFEKFLTHDGLGLPENDTYLKAAVASVVDSILDFKAKDMGLFTIFDQQFRDEVTIFNMDTYHPAYDYIKRYLNLASSDFKVLIEYEGKKWAESQNFEDVEKNVEDTREFYNKFSEDIGVLDRNIRINKAIYSLLQGGGELTERSLETYLMFDSQKKLHEFIYNYFKLYQVGNEDKVKDIVQKALESGFFKIEEKVFYCLKVNKANKLQFFNSLPLQDFKSLEQLSEHDTQGHESTNEKNCGESNSLENTDDVIESVSKELEDFEKAFFDLLVKLIERFEKSKLYDNVLDTAIIPAGKKPLRLIYAEKSLLELLYIFHEIINAYMLRSMILWPKKIKDKDILYKLYSIVFNKIADIRKVMHQALSSFHGGRFNQHFVNYVMSNTYATQNLLKHMQVFKDSGMEKEAEPLFGSMWKIYKECKEWAYPEPLLYGWNFDYNNDSWKKFVELQMEHPDHTYSNYINNLSKLSSSSSGINESVNNKNHC